VKIEKESCYLVSSIYSLLAYLFSEDVLLKFVVKIKILKHILICLQTPEFQQVP